MDFESLCRKRTLRFACFILFILIFWDSSNPGSYPEYGAIFMANHSTRKECFERKLFGLPYEYADFVREVKTGMLLFLFDFQERKLYGVFKAASDGMMNIIPNAYHSTSKKKFPAQVRFSTFWHCDPLPESMFCDAIKENYFQKFKFNIGLSRDQVGRLLWLFQKNLLRVPSQPVSERQQQRSSPIEKSVVITVPSSLENSESVQSSIPEVEDYIPLPSIEPEEIDDLSAGFLCEAGLSSLWSLAVDGSDDDDKKDDSSLPFQGLYSDMYSDKQRTSAFLRLSGLGEVLEEERHHHNEMDDVRDILKGLDKRHRLWKCKNTDNASTSRVSVFSRLKCNVRMPLDSKQKVITGAGEMKPMDIAKVMTCQNPKSSSGCCENRMMTNGKYHNLRKQHSKALESQQMARGVAGGMKAADIAKEFIQQTLKCKRTCRFKKNAEDHKLPANQCGIDWMGITPEKEQGHLLPDPPMCQIIMSEGYECL